MKVGQLFLADIGRDINPVIKVADYTQAELQRELEDYVVTDSIEKYLLDFLEHYTDTRQKQTDRVGVWISGYVGSGKSHFAKLLSLLTANPQVAGRTAIDRFRPRLATCRQAREIERHLYEMATFLPTEVIGFQIDAVAIKGQQDDICNILYRQFLAHRGLSTDLKIALLIEEPLLERGALGVYRQTVRELAGKPWEDIRQRPMLYWDEVFEALARTLPDRFKSAAAAQEGYDRSSVQPTFQQLAKDLTAYVARQQAQHRDQEVRLLCIIDELGQFVADSGPRILDVQSFAEEIATQGKGRVWLAVTSHESMQDVVKNSREFRGDIKKLEGRFAKRVTLTTENIELVLEERLFKKSKAGEDELRKLYQQRGGSLRDVGELGKVDRALPACDEGKFLACCPFLPYQLMLIPDTLHGLRVAGGRGEALTGAHRSLLGITQGVLKHQSYAQAEVGRLVSLDEIYAEVEDSEIPSEVRRELSGVGTRVSDPAFPLVRILRVLYLLQQVPYAPRTLDNLARLLVSRLDADFSALRSQVEAGLQQLIAARYVARTGDHCEYLSRERKRIEEEIAEEDVRTAHKRDKLKKFLTPANLEVGTIRYEDTFRKGERKSPSEALQHATTLYIREATYTWFNRLVALRCLEARVSGVDESIKVKPDYAYRSLRHDRFCRQHPELCQGEDGGLAAFLREASAEAARELPLLFDPDAPLTLIAPSPDALQKCVRAFSGEVVSFTRRASDRAEGLTDDIFREADLLGWVYQYWNDEEKDRVFEAAAHGKKIEGADIIPATCIYTEDYMVRFLVENSLGALWAEMHPDSRLPERWQYFVRDTERRSREPCPVGDLTFLDPACGSGHFLVYAFDVLWDMYHEEGQMTDPAEICRGILERNLYGIDIDERSVQIAAVALYLKAKERAPHFTPRRVNLVAANAAMPRDAIQRYLKEHPQDEPLRGVLDVIFEGLENVNEVGSLLQIEEQLDRALEELRKQELRRANSRPEQISMLPLLGLQISPAQGQLDLDTLPPRTAWKEAVLDRLHEQFQREADAKDLSTAIFGTEAEKGLDLIELLSRQYDVVATNPPYMGSKNMGPVLKAYVQRQYPAGKRDLYAAFIQRCLQLAKHSGRVAMVTQQSWMFLRSFAELRKGVVEQQAIECLAHLGPRAFEEISGEVVNVALFVLTQAPPLPEHRLWATRLVGPKSAGEKAALLREAILATRTEDRLLHTMEAAR